MGQLERRFILCSVCYITLIFDSEYTIYVQVLRSTDKARYLGVTIDSTLTWYHHIDIITKEANNTTAFLRRNISSCLPDVKAICYKTLTCAPQLKYASSIWVPHTQSNINKTEAVQRSAARFVTGDYRRTTSVSSMLGHLGCRRSR